MQEMASTVQFFSIGDLHTCCNLSLFDCQCLLYPRWKCSIQSERLCHELWHSVRIHNYSWKLWQLSKTNLWLHGRTCITFKIFISHRSFCILHQQNTLKFLLLKKWLNSVHHELRAPVFCCFFSHYSKWVPNMWLHTLNVPQPLFSFFFFFF